MMDSYNSTFVNAAYVAIGSLKKHEETKHNAKVPPVIKPKTSKESDTRSDDFEIYFIVLF